MEGESPSEDVYKVLGISWSYKVLGISRSYKVLGISRSYKEDVYKVLGISRSYEEDCFVMNLAEIVNNVDHPTKRDVVKTLPKI